MKLEELKRKAEAATPGPWELSHAGEGTRGGGFQITEYYVRLPGADFALAADVIGSDMKPSEANATYIASASPDVVLRLIAVAQAAKAVLDCFDEYRGYNEMAQMNMDEEAGEKSDALREAIEALEGKQHG